MRVPSATDLFFVVAGDVTEVVDRSLQIVLKDYGVQGNAKVFLVELVNGSLRIRKDALVPGERTVLRVPAGRTKSSAEIDEGVTGKFFLSKCFGFGNYLIMICESAMRLLIAERPERGQLRMAGEFGVFGH